MFNTGWERGGVQSAKRMSANQQHEANYMECPFIVRYNDGYWIHEFYAANSYLQPSSFDCLAEGTGNNA